jgi:hypothetical protein
MRIPMLAALLLLLFFSCNQSEYKKEDSPSTTRSASAPASAPASASGLTSASAADSATHYPIDGEAQFKSPSPDQPGQQPRTGPPAEPAANAANPDWDRKIVKTADLNIETKSFQRFTTRLYRLVRDNGGYIAQEEQKQDPSGIENTVSIKVPVDRFDDLLQQLPADSDRVAEKKVNSQDVSVEVVDNRSRLETKKEVRERYLALLRQAHNTQDVLTIQQDIDGIQGEMDAAASRISYLGHAAAFSTINLKFYQVLNLPLPEAPAPTFLHRVKLSFLEGWYFVSTLGLGLLTVWPLWLALGLGLAAWRRYQSRTTRKPV